MKCKAVQVKEPNVWSFGELELPEEEGELVLVKFSSLCHTDCQIIDGSLSYYKQGLAHYPIIPGHEWCGLLEGQPVVGVCILGCQECLWCKRGRETCCSDRKEVGVVNKNGGFSELLLLPRKHLIEIPDLSPIYVFAEPLAVVVHGLHRLPRSLNSFNGILINGFGTIGKLCFEVCKEYGSKPDIRDPRFSFDANPSLYELIIECSGGSTSLENLHKVRGQTVLAYGFEYNKMEPGVFVSNEVNFIGTLGATKQDFSESVKLLPRIKTPEYSILPLSQFSKGLSRILDHEKTVFTHGDL